MYKSHNRPTSLLICTSLLLSPPSYSIHPNDFKHPDAHDASPPCSSEFYFPCVSIETPTNEPAFFSLLDRLQKNDRSLTSLDLSHLSLTASHLDTLAQSLQLNTHLGHITWPSYWVETRHHEEMRRIEAKVLQNNLSYDFYPSDYILGLLSLHSYEDAQPGELLSHPALHGWRVVNVFQEETQYSVLYKQDHTEHLVLAHRGADFSGLFNQINMDLSLSKATADFFSLLKGSLLELFANFTLSQQAFTHHVTEMAATFARTHHLNLSLTGHSFGAWLAELSSYFCHSEFKIFPHTVTFDSPGAYDMIASLQPNVISQSNQVDVRHFDNTTYLSAPNMVNSAHRHFGKVYRVFPHLKPGPTPPWLEKLLLVSPLTAFPLEALRAFESGTLKVILDQFDPHTHLPLYAEEVLDWPRIKYDTPSLIPEGEFNRLVEGGLEWAPPLLKSFIRKHIHALIPQMGKDLLKILNIFYDLSSGAINQEQYWGIVQSETHHDGKPHATTPLQHFQLTYKYHYKTQPMDPCAGVLEEAPGSDDHYLEQLIKHKHTLSQSNLSSLTKAHVQQAIQWVKAIDAPHLLKKRSLWTHVPLFMVRKFIKRLRMANHELTSWITSAPLHPHVTSFVSNIHWPQKLLARTLLERDTPIAQISEAFKNHSIALISGPKGAGKTTLAYAYAHQWNKPTRWMKASSPSEIASHYRHWAADLHMDSRNWDNESIMEQVHNEIKDHPHGLLIFDDVTQEDHVASYLSNLPPPIKALVITDNSNILEDFPHVQLTSFTFEEGIDYLTKALKGKKTASKNDLACLIQEIGLLPDRLAWAAKYLTDPHHRLRTVTGLLKKIQDSKATAHPLDPIFTRIIQTLSNQSPLAWELLRHATLLHHDFIPMDLLATLLQVTADELNEPIFVLESHALGQVRESNGQLGLWVPRFAQEEAMAYGHYCPEQAPELTRPHIIDTLNEVFPKINENPQSGWTEALLSASHAHGLTEDMKTASVSKSFVSLIDKLGCYHTYLTQDYHQALAYHQRAQTFYTLHFSDGESSLDSLEAISWIYGLLEDHDVALEQQKNLLTLTEETLGQNHMRVATVLNNMGWTYTQIEHYKEALSCHLRALDMRRAVFGNHSREVADSYTSLSWTYTYLSEHEQAHLYMNAALSILERLQP